jgi:Ca2+-binding RTX toxin-like protein
MMLRLLLPCALVVALALPPAAGASLITYDGHAVVYTAAPREANLVSVNTSQYDTSCAPLSAPCLTINDGYANTTTSGGCTIVYSGLGSNSVVCPVPAIVRADLGDNDDSWFDWDGPSVVDAGAGNDNPLIGRGGDDVFHGGSGNDVLIGEGGDDTLDGGSGDDDFEGIPGGVETGHDTSGADTMIGGGGLDSVTYETRSEDLSLSLDGVANDGAPGERDNIGADVTLVVGGNGSDTLTGNDARNIFYGSVGDDLLTGAGGDDTLYGGNGNDRLDAGPGTDFLEGDSGDDTLSGGPDVDQFYGEDPLNHYAGEDRILARDGNQENIHCGTGIDSAQIDRLDNISGTWWGTEDQCETLDAAGAGGTPSSTALSIAAVTADRRGRLTVRLTVPSAGKADVSATVRRARIARTRRTVRAAGSVRLRLKLKRALPRRTTKVTVRVRFTASGGRAERVSRVAKLRARR